MLNQILALTWKDLKIFLRDFGAVALIFLQRFMFVVVMSYALGGLFSAGGDQPVHLLAVNQDQGTQAATVLQQLDEMDAFEVETAWEGQLLTRETAERLVAAGKRSLAIVFPPDFSAVLEQDPGSRSRQTTKVTVIADPATSSQFVEPIRNPMKSSTCSEHVVHPSERSDASMIIRLVASLDKRARLE